MANSLVVAHYSFDGTASWTKKKYLGNAEEMWLLLDKIFLPSSALWVSFLRIWGQHHQQQKQWAPAVQPKVKNHQKWQIRRRAMKPLLRRTIKWCFAMVVMPSFTKDEERQCSKHLFEI